VWAAITEAERINRWFLPISGDLRLGGHYQFEGIASGEILACEPPVALRISWVLGEPSPETTSEVDVRLSSADGGTLFELTHGSIWAGELWDQFGPGGVGVGWDLGLLGLALHLRSGGSSTSIEDIQAAGRGDDARSFMTAASQAWGEVYRSSGANPDAVAAAVAATTAFYAPPFTSLD
jgi:uncharacterized protein YndB with AHSA1/START domain